MTQHNHNELRRLYRDNQAEIEKTWQRRKQPKTQQETFALLVSCLLSSGAKWATVKKTMEKLRSGDTLFQSNIDEIETQLNCISGKYINKHRLAEYIIEARESFPFVYMVVKGIHSNQFSLNLNGIDQRDVRRSTDAQEFLNDLTTRGICPDGLRQLVRGIRAAGMKQASHFLASIGFEDYAILDLHVLRFLVTYGVIPEKPKNLTSARYREIENQMKAFSKSVGIPFHHLDTLWWQLGSASDDC
jgi:thermostable 8-oxoguanine DNA glycosylase